MKDFVDDLYRRASEDPDIPFNEEAWDRMDQKLDYAARKRRRGLIWLFFLLFVSLGAGLLWGIQGMGTFDQKIKKEKYTGPVAENAQPDQRDKIKTEQNSSLKETGKNQARGFNADVAIAKDPKEQGDVNQTGNQTNFLKTAPRLFTSEQQGSRKRAKPSSGNQAKAKAQFNQDKSKFVEDLAAISLNEKVTTKKDTLLNVYRVDEPDWLVLETLPAAGVLINELNRLPEPKIIGCTMEVPPVAKLRSWGIGLSAGPDLASVNANGSTAYGLNAGLAFDYRIGKRWVFQASGQYLLKNYIADQREYVAPNGFWPTRSYPKSTEGTCDMLQWSVDLRYNWLAKPKFKSFVSLGSSSWTILKEEYEFYYAKDYPGLIYNWSSGQNKNYWLSMAQMGIGIEKTIRPGLSLQLNWFAQMPLQGVGNGKVEIYSSGLGFMVHKQMGRLKK
ncbi:outer membrane beta-barrel protein [Haliscomenobacter sp.]|uniref:outer membrane beta-barrel protein n=1 Tax=Haliscomenobacter sp. TaxID=2717303 RepID=UPI003BAA6EF8